MEQKRAHLFLRIHLELNKKKKAGTSPTFYRGAIYEAIYNSDPLSADNA